MEVGIQPSLSVYAVYVLWVLCRFPPATPVSSCSPKLCNYTNWQFRILPIVNELLGYQSSSNHLSCAGLLVGMEPIPVSIGHKAGVSQHAYIHTHTLTSYTTGVLNPTAFYLDCIPRQSTNWTCTHSHRTALQVSNELPAQIRSDSASQSNELANAQ